VGYPVVSKAIMRLQSRLQTDVLIRKVVNQFEETMSNVQT
jgi:hypothetical protein